MEGIFYTVTRSLRWRSRAIPMLPTKSLLRNKSAIPDPAGGGGPQKYDGNRFPKSGVSESTLDNGDVMFFNDQLASTTNPAEVYSIALPIDEFVLGVCVCCFWYH